MSEYKLTVGLEIHAELNTQTKMFCDSLNDPNEKEPNVNICPICMGHPGTLPVMNKEAVKYIRMIGTAIGAKLAEKTYFDRKHYFYPDIPKGYQISQYKDPLVTGGEIAGIELTRIHLEEDTAKSQHDTGDHSIVDFNRAGVPLMELVTEPVIHGAEDAVRFAKELQLLLRALGAGEANMEKGEMRVEANISVSKTDELGTKVEVKNLNSFKAVERAIVYEYDRHIAMIESGEKIKQETRGWDEAKQKTFNQRSKENAEDYRYFPEPDLPPLDFSELPELSEDVLRNELPELPWNKRKRYIADHALREEAAELFVTNPSLGNFFEAVVTKLTKNEMTKTASNYITSDLVGLLKGGDIPETLEVDAFAQLIHMVTEGEISSRGAKDILKIMVEQGGFPELIARDNGLLQSSNKEELLETVQGIIEEHAGVVEEYKGGKEASLQFLIGQGMKATKGSANPALLKELFLEQLAK